MELREQFETAAAESKNLSAKPDSDTLLQLYSLYKQSTDGDINSAPPTNPFDFVSKATLIFTAHSDACGCKFMDHLMIYGDNSNLRNKWFHDNLNKAVYQKCSYSQACFIRRKSNYSGIKTTGFSN